MSVAPKHSRRLNLQDVMILVGAMAIQLAYEQVRDPYYRQYYDVPTTRVLLHEILEFPPTVSSIPDVAVKTSELFTRHAPSLLLWTLTWLVLRLRGPRPNLRHLARKPGFVACLVAVAVTAFGSVSTLVYQAGLFGSNPADWLIAGIWTQRIGFSVAAAWLTLALNRRWRPERGWIDRMGRVLGWLWVASAVLPPWDS